MKFTDTHTHIYFDDFEEDIEEVMKRATDANIHRFFLPGIDLGSLKKMLPLVAKYPQNCFPAIGIHPNYITRDFLSDVSQIPDYLSSHNFCAIGEIGIDLYRNSELKNEQIEAFEYQIGIAQQHNLPIIIHCRNAFKETIEVIKKYNNVRGVFHSFTGNVTEAKKIIDRGYKLGVNGIITFKNSDLDGVIKKIDLKNIVLETDTPFLAPVPYRGQRNEPSYLIHIAKKLSDIYKIPMEDIARFTTENSKDIFGV